MKGNNFLCYYQQKISDIRIRKGIVQESEIVELFTKNNIDFTFESGYYPPEQGDEKLHIFVYPGINFKNLYILVSLLSEELDLDIIFRWNASFWNHKYINTITLSSGYGFDAYDEFIFRTPEDILSMDFEITHNCFFKKHLWSYYG